MDADDASSGGACASRLMPRQDAPVPGPPTYREASRGSECTAQLQSAGCHVPAQGGDIRRDDVARNPWQLGCERHLTDVPVGVRCWQRRAEPHDGG